MIKNREINFLYYLFLKQGAKLVYVEPKRGDVYFINSVDCFYYSFLEELSQTIIPKYNLLTWRDKAKYRIKRFFTDSIMLLQYQSYYRWKE
jgi:hypothetical protein